MIGADWKIETAVDPSAQPGRGDGAAGEAAGGRAPSPRPPPRRHRARRPAWATDEALRARPAGPSAARVARPGPESIAAARSNIAPTRNGDEPAAGPDGPDPDADAHRDDPVAEDNGLDSTELLAARARRDRDRRDPARLTT